MYEIQGSFQGSGLNIGIVASRFNERIGDKLVDGAVDCLERHGVAESQITLAWVPGALEIPLVAKKMAQTGQYDAIICLGAVIRGATYHFDVVANQSASGVSQASLDTGVPILSGILTVDSIEQAVERAGSKCGNKGFEVAMAALEMANLLKVLPEQERSYRPKVTAPQGLL